MFSFAVVATAVAAFAGSSPKPDGPSHVAMIRRPPSHDELLALRRRRRDHRAERSQPEAPSKAVAKLNGDIDKLGEYYMKLFIGGQIAELQVDTGSSDLGLPAVGCRGCEEHVDAWYDPTRGGATKIACGTVGFGCNPCHYGQCAFDISYADGSGFRAALWTDQIALDEIGTLNVTAPVGAIYMKHKGEFEPKAVNGIIGFAYRSIASANESTLFEAWVDGALLANVFAMCLTDHGGRLVLGGTGDEYTMGPFVYTPIIEETYYVVNMTDLRVGGTSLGLPSKVYNDGGAIVDSGSTDIALPQTAFDALVARLNASCAAGTKLVGLCGEPSKQTLFDGYCVALPRFSPTRHSQRHANSSIHRITVVATHSHSPFHQFALNASEVAAWPTLEIALGGGVTLSLNSSTYLTGDCGGSAGYYTTGIDASADGDGTVLGDVAMKPYTVVFDRAAKRVGFAPSRCS